MKKSLILLPVLLAGGGCMSEKNCIPPDQERAEAAFQYVAPYSESLWHKNYNKDEKKVPKYILPEFQSKSVAEWEKTERPKILQQFKDIMYGKMPPAPDFMEMKLMAQKNDALDGLAIRKEYRIFCRMKNGKKFDFDMLLYVPKHVKTPPPVFVQVNFNGNNSGTPELDVLKPRGMYMNSKRQFCPLNFPKHKKAMARLSILESVKRGYAVATANYWEFCPDYMTGIKISPFTMYYDAKDLRMDYEVPFSESKACKWRRPVSAIGVWAWGYSRILDALEKEPLVDAKRAAAVGHSRLGKTALWAGACDERFKMVISNNSGCCGAALSRRKFGETLEIAFWEDRNWYCGGLADYIVNVDKMPIDQHMLLALIAPRTLCVASATKDLNADPKGEFLATKAASPVWNLYGMKGLENQRSMPKPDHFAGTDYLYYWYRTGEHALTAADWAFYYKVADKVLKRSGTDCQELKKTLGATQPAMCNKQQKGNRQ